MGQLDYLLGGAARVGATSTGRRPSPFGSPSRFVAPRLRVGGGASTMQPPERFDVNQTFDDLSNSGAGIFATAGQLPSRVMENPVSIADTAARLATGGRISDGKAVGGFSPVAALGQTPLGAVGGFLGEATERSGNFIPSLINSTDANVWKVVGDLPDNTPITDELVRGRLEAMGESSLFAEGEKTEGVPVLGALPFLRHVFGGRAKTVGELKDELNRRGFFFDENTGQPIDPVEMAHLLRSGKQSTFNFGYAATNDNALVDVVTRLTTDPSNALFFVPGGALAKLGSAGTRLLPAARLVRAGAMAERAPRAISAASAILQGDRAQATLGGLARVLKGYRTAAVASTVATFGVNTAANAINGLADDELPFITEIRDFTGAVQNAQPMSGNAAFMLLGAATFPYGAYAKKGVEGIRAVRNRVVGVEDMSAFHREYGGRAAFEEQFGGPQGVNELAGFLDVQIARDLGLVTPGEVAKLTNIGAMSLRRKIEQMALARVVNRARRDGLITSDMRLSKFQEFHSQQGGFKEQGLANPWDAARAARRWRAWQPVRKAVQPILDDTGEVIWGLRDDVIFHEQIDATRGNLKAAIYKDANGVKRVRIADILDVLEDNPNLNSLDTTGKWSKWATGDVDPTWDSVSRKLSSQKRDAVHIDDYTAELTEWERSAPKDIEAPERVPRQERIAQLRQRMDELESEHGIDGVETGNPFDAAEQRIVRAYRNNETSTEIGTRSPEALIREYPHPPGGTTTDFPGLVESIRNEGFDAERPIDITPDGRVLDGHNRLAAALELGLTEVPVRVHRPQGRYALTPEILDEHQAVQRELEDLLAQENDVHWARTETMDRKTGGDPKVGRGIDEAVESDPLLAPPRLSPGLDKLDPATVDRVAALEAEVLKINPSYRVKRAPTQDILALVPEDSAISVALRHRRATAEWLFEAGPFSPLSNFWHALTRPVNRAELGAGAKQTLMNELIPLGVEPKSVEAILNTLDARVKDSIILQGPGGFTVRAFRDIGSIPPGQVNRIVAEVLNRGHKKGTQHKALANIEAAGGFYRILAKSGSRYGRAITSKAAKGDKGAKVLKTVYDIWNDAPVLNKVATGQRVVAKFLYPLFRFSLDPRWLALNMTEANALALSKHGFIRTYRNMEEASPAARHFASGEDAIAQGSLAPDVGWSLGRELELFAAKSFDVANAGSVAKVIDDMGNNSPVLREIRRNMQMEGELLLQRAQRDLDAGDITKRQFDADVARAQRLQEGGKGAMSEHLNDTLYGYEAKGVEATVIDEARKVLRAEEIDVLRESGMLDRLVEVNRKTWNDVQQMYHGNPQRNTLERLMNSYWFFWPLSYQIKATKWLTDIMLNGSFGQNNNALLAGKYALFQQEHQERMRNNPAYAAMMEAHPTLWFASQLLLPMSPEDIGVSLSRATRLAGTHAQGFLNGWLGTEIGVFTAEKQMEDPAAAIGWLTNMGPTYTVELAQRLFNEADDVARAPSAPTQNAPTPSAGLPSLPAR